jgi:hypothetical protein
LSLAAFVLVVVPGSSYLFASRDYSRCSPAKSRVAVERCLTFYVVDACEEKPLTVRGIGRDPNQVCVQYKILGFEPIYAIYDRQGTTVGWYDVYE